MAGKIAGRIVHADSGEPLPGAAIRIEGTTLGDAADNDGYYAIINVKPGTYTLVASMIGFAALRIENVEVSVDRTTSASTSSCRNPSLKAKRYW